MIASIDTDDILSDDIVYYLHENFNINQKDIDDQWNKAADKFKNLFSVDIKDTKYLTYPLSRLKCIENIFNDLEIKKYLGLN